MRPAPDIEIMPVAVSDLGQFNQNLDLNRSAEGWTEFGWERGRDPSSLRSRGRGDSRIETILTLRRRSRALRRTEMAWIHRSCPSWKWWGLLVISIFMVISLLYRTCLAWANGRLLSSDPVFINVMHAVINVQHLVTVYPRGIFKKYKQRFE